MIVTFDPINGDVVPDGKIDEYVSKIDGDVTIGSEVMLSVMRVAHKNGEIVIDYILFDNQLININGGGKLDCWPRGFADTYEKALYSLL